MFSFLPLFSMEMGVVAHNSRAMVLGNFQCQHVLLIWIIVGQGPTVLAVGAGAVVWIFFHFSPITSLFFLPLSGRRFDID